MLKVMVLFIVVCNELGTPQRLLHCAAGLSLGVLLQAMVGMYQYATRQHLGLDILGETGAGTTDQLSADSVRGQGVFRVGAFLNHPNIFGAYLAALLPMSLSVFLLKKGGPMKAMCMLAASLGAAALMASLSRSGWLSFAVASAVLVLLVLLHGRLRMKVLLPAGAAALVLAVVLLAFAGPIAARIFDSKPDAVLGRAEYNRTAAGVIAAKPWLGHGLNSYVYVAPPYTRYGPRKAADVYKNWLPPVHNIYLLWTAETGYIGLTVHLALVVSLLVVAIRNLKVRDETLFMINVACLCGVTALLVDGLFSFTLRINSVMRVFWVLAAMIMAIHYLHLREPRPDRAATNASRAA
jgi:putative inorganic carbon (HCO3(-)) transporter